MYKNRWSSLLGLCLLSQGNLECCAPYLVSQDFKCMFSLWVQPCTAVSTGVNHRIGLEVKWLLKRSVAEAVQNCAMMVQFDKFVQHFAESYGLIDLGQQQFRDCCTTHVMWHRHTLWHFQGCCVVSFSPWAPCSCMVNLCSHAQRKPGAPGMSP